MLVQFAETLATTLADARRADSTPPDSDSHKSFKPRDPEKFSGKDRSKLPEFIAQCRIVYLSQPRKFTSDTAKILFMGSFLESPALDWFSSIFMKERPAGEELPPFCTEFSAFTSKLETLFGEPDRQHRAEEELRNLRMKDNHRVTRYITDFDRLNYQLPDWTDRPLADTFYRGLAPRLKMSISGLPQMRPRELEPLKQLAVLMDENYWEYKNDSSGSQVTSTSSGPSSNSAKKQNTSPSTSSSSPKPSKPASSSPATPKHIGTDGRLTDAEKQRRAREGLCNYCGEKGHFVNECPGKPKDSGQAPSGSNLSKGRSTWTLSPDGTVTQSSDTSDSVNSSTSDSGNA